MQFVLFQRRPGQRQMPTVHRIEGAAKKSYIHASQVSPA
jgi:hypothetical protein